MTLQNLPCQFSTILVMFLNIFITLIYSWVGVCARICPNSLVEVSPQLPLPCGSQGSTSDQQAWWQAYLPASTFALCFLTSPDGLGDQQEREEQ